MWPIFVDGWLGFFLFPYSWGCHFTDASVVCFSSKTKTFIIRFRRWCIFIVGGYPWNWENSICNWVCLWYKDENWKGSQIKLIRSLREKDYFSILMLKTRYSVQVILNINLQIKIRKTGTKNPRIMIPPPSKIPILSFNCVNSCICWQWFHTFCNIQTANTDTKQRLRTYYKLTIFRLRFILTQVKYTCKHIKVHTAINGHNPDIQ